MSYSVSLANVDLTVICDKSGSMSRPDTPSKKSRWLFMQEYVGALVTELGAHDRDGIDLVIFDDQFAVSEGVTPDSIFAVFDNYKPSNGTVLVPPLQWAFNKAQKKWGDKQQLILVITDGEPQDREAVASAIIDFTKSMEDDSQLAITFLQVGGDSEAARFLTGLDDALQSRGAKFDIVDTGKLEDLCKLSLQELVDKTFND